MGNLKGDLNRTSDPREIHHAFMMLVESFFVVVYEDVNGIDGWLFKGRDDDWDRLPLSKNNASRIYSFIMDFPGHNYQGLLKAAFGSFREKYGDSLLIPQNLYRNSYIFRRILWRCCPKSCVYP